MKVAFFNQTPGILTLGRFGLVGKIPDGHEGGRSAVCVDGILAKPVSANSDVPPGSFLEREFP
ncbi:MAG: hypothetical protein JWM11_5981 [Planctomycetaceae bacterium]|nr:hypothetical protein [Planctomycetaceae bacterium]